MRTLSPTQVRRKNMLSALSALTSVRETIAAEVHRMDKAEGANEKTCSFCDRSHTHAEVGFVMHAEGSANDVSICDVCIDLAEDRLTAARFDAHTAKNLAA